MPSMKAVRIHAYGGADVLAYEDAPRPTAGMARCSSVFMPPRSILSIAQCERGTCQPI